MLCCFSLLLLEEQRPFEQQHIIQDTSIQGDQQQHPAFNEDPLMSKCSFPASINPLATFRVLLNFKYA